METRELLDETHEHRGATLPASPPSRGLPRIEQSRPSSPPPPPPPRPGYLGDRGADSFGVDVPAGFVFQGAALEVQDGRHDPGARIQNEPWPGDTGHKGLAVRWHFERSPLQTYIRYRIRAWAVERLRPEHRVGGFHPSSHGLHFINGFTGLNYTVKTGLLSGQEIDVPFINPSYGVCGGMAFAVRDLFESGFLVPPDTQPPASGTLHDYIMQRLSDSFNPPGGLTHYLELMDPLLADGDRPGKRGRNSIVLEAWDRIRADIDRGQLSPVGLVLVQSLNPLDLPDNHQVLAWGYSELGSDYGLLFLYDPNLPNLYIPGVPNGDQVTLAFRIADRNEPAEFQSTYSPFYGFFHNDYSGKRPPGVGTRACARVKLMAANGKYVVAEGGRSGAVNANRDPSFDTLRRPGRPVFHGAASSQPEPAYEWEIFTLEKAGQTPLTSADLINIKAANGNYVVAEGRGGGPVNANRPQPANWERFVVERVAGDGAVASGDLVTLRTDDGHHLTVEGDTITALGSDAFDPPEPETVFTLTLV